MRDKNIKIIKIFMLRVRMCIRFLNGCRRWKSYVPKWNLTCSKCFLIFYLFSSILIASNKPLFLRLITSGFSSTLYYTHKRRARKHFSLIKKSGLIHWITMRVQNIVVQLGIFNSVRYILFFLCFLSVCSYFQIL